MCKAAEVAQLLHNNAMRWNKRYSFCCDQDDCRHRRTTESVRFLGRKVYAGLIVVLISAMMHGLKPERVRRIREVLDISPQYLKALAPMVAG